MLTLERLCFEACEIASMTSLTVQFRSTCFRPAKFDPATRHLIASFPDIRAAPSSAFAHRYRAKNSAQFNEVRSKRIGKQS
jgi:hypothetical protein